MVEKLKSAGIFLLIITLVLQLVVTFALGNLDDILDYFNGSPFKTTGQTSPPESVEDSAAVCAFPAVIGVVGENSVYSPQSEEDYNAIYGLIAPILSEALGSSGEEKPIDKEEFYSHLGGPAIYLRYSAHLPLWLHTNWTESFVQKSDNLVDTFVISAKGGVTTLAYLTDKNQYFAMESATNPSKIESICQRDYPFNVDFAFKTGQTNLRPDDLLPRGFVDLATYTSLPFTQSDGENAVKIALEAFGIRHYMSSYFVTSKGEIQYIDQAASLTISEEGRLTFSNVGALEPIISYHEKGSKAEMTAVIEKVRALAFEVWIGYGSFGTLSLGSAQYNAEEDTYLLSFDLFAGGIPIKTETPPVEAVIKNGRALAIKIMPRRAEISGSATLAFTQLAAAASPKNHHIGLGYILENNEYTPAAVVFEGRQK